MTEAYAAIITAVITSVVGPLITYYFTAILPLRVFPAITATSKKRLDGIWTGTGRQQDGPHGNVLEHTLSITLNCGTRKISGDATMHVAVADERYILNFKIEGVFFEDRIVSFTYRNTDVGVRQYGSAVLQLDDPGKNLSGVIIGYGFLSKKIVEVQTELKKTT